MSNFLMEEESLDDEDTDSKGASISGTIEKGMRTVFGTVSKNVVSTSAKLSTASNASPVIGVGGIVAALAASVGGITSPGKYIKIH